MRPTPGQVKTVSVMTAPASSEPNSRPPTVSTGTSALRRACFRTIMRGVPPLARAVRT